MSSAISVSTLAAFRIDARTNKEDISNDVALSFISKSKISAPQNEIILNVVVSYPNASEKLMQDHELHATTIPVSAKPITLLIFIRRN